MGPSITAPNDTNFCTVPSKSLTSKFKKGEYPLVAQASLASARKNRTSRVVHATPFSPFGLFE